MVSELKTVPNKIVDTPPHTQQPPVREEALPTSDSATESPALANDWYASRWHLFLTGFLVLFLEMACIRWFAASAVFLQFFTNLVLISCFVGMSIGCLCSRQKTDWLLRFPAITFGCVILVMLLRFLYDHWSQIAIDVGSQSSPQVVFFGTEARNVDLAKFVIPMEVLGGTFFVLIALMFVGLGQVLGKCFDAYPNRVVAYTMNIAGSLAGIAVFAAVSYAGMSPLVWFVVGFAGVAYFLKHTGKFKRVHVMCLIGVAALIGLSGHSFRADKQLHWSPYYAVTYDTDTHLITANTVGHQQMHSWKEPGSVYSLVHLLQRDITGKPFEDILIIGAGSGNDVSHSLLHGVADVDAVEIDPVIQRLGEQYHPDQPYSNPRVHVHLNDGRNFLKSTDKKYDLVVFALVDSLILHSSYSNIRLESFLFTQQAFDDVRRVLKPDGVFVMYNFFRQGWIVERINGMFEKAFGEKPLVFSLPYAEQIKPTDNLADRMTMFIAGHNGHFVEAFEKHGEYRLNRHVAKSLGVDGFRVSPHPDDDEWLTYAPARVTAGTASIGSATDDWPFLYLRKHMLPSFYLRSMAIIAGLGLVMLWWFSPGRRLSFNGRMFFLGAAFLLLETKAVVHLALVFGSTWMVNSLVFFAILVMILGSNLYVLKVRRIDLRWHYAGLLVCLAANCLVPFDIFLAGGLVWKYVMPCFLAMIPVFFAGVIFAVTFRDSRRPNRDFGSNIAGSVVGGLAEYSSMLLGFRYVLVVAILFYGLSACFRRRPA